MPNPFEKRSEIDKKRAGELLAKSSEDYNRTILAARECTKLEQFKEYKTRCEQTTKVLFEIFLLTPSSDPISEGVRVKINAMRLLGVDILANANLELRPTKPKEPVNGSN